MNKYILFIPLLFCTIWVSAQESTKLTGRVIDATTKQPIPAVSIQYQKSGLSTISNSEGEFILSKAGEPDFLVFSHISYATKKVSTLDTSYNILLEENTVSLPEITVVSVPVNTIIQDVWNKYNAIHRANKKNKNKHTFFYRQITQTDTLYNEFIESFFLGKSTYGIDDLVLTNGRTASVKVADGEFALSISNFFHQSCARPFYPKNPPNEDIVNVFLQPNAAELYNISLDQIIESDDMGSIYVLSYIPKDDVSVKYIFKGKLFIRKADWAILKFEAELNSSGLSDTDIVKITKTANKIEVSYKYYDQDYPIVESVKCFAAIDLTHDNKPHKVNVSFTLFLAEYNAGKSGKKLKQKTNLLESILKSKFDAEFWDNNPIIKRTALEDEIIETFKNKNIVGSFQP